MSENTEIHPNICFVVDATASMGTTLIALKEVFSQLFPLLPILVEAKFHLIIYRDFDCHDDDDVYKYWGPFEAKDVSQIVAIMKNTSAKGGADGPECQKYAFWRLLDDIPMENRVVFHFTDAPPHSYPFPVRGNDNHFREGLKLKVNGFNPDWVNLCQEYQSQNIPVYTIGYNKYNYYVLLAEMTGGEMVSIKNTSADYILKATIIVFARAFGYDECNLYGLASIVRLDESATISTTENSSEFRNMKMTQIEFTDSDQLVDVRQAYTDLVHRIVLEKRYNSSPEYQITCFNTFIDLIEGGNILALTYNPLLGCLYRLMCRRSKIAQTEEKRDQLNRLISDTIGKIKHNTNKDTYNKVSAWMEESYNRIEEINEMIMSIEGLLVPFLGLQTVKRMTKKDLTLACKIPLPQNLNMLSDLISSIVVFDSKPKNMPEVFVPLSLDDDVLFSMLSHLMCPGVKLDRKPSIVLALVTLNSGNAILADRALSFLRKSCGKWFEREASEWYLFGIIKLILKLEKEHGGILTDQEKELFDNLFRISALKYNNSELDCQRKFRLSPVHGIKYPDYKAKCQSCDQFRSASIMTPEGCGICVYISRNEEPSVDLIKLSDDDSKKSYLFDCTVCGGRYAVRDIDGLNARPKCHYCRLQPPLALDKIPKVNCSICDINMILPDSSNINSTIENFICEVCVENGGEERIETISVRLHDLLKENPELVPNLIGMDIDLKILTGRESLYSIRDKYKLINTEHLLEPTELVYEDRNLINISEILQDIKNIIVTGSLGTEACIICYNEFIHHELESFCYNKNCEALGCQKCIKNWFSENKPGFRVMQNRTTCPCCKRKPVKGLAFTNSCLKTLLNQRITYDPNWHYAWCKGCGNVKEYMEYQCAGPDPMEINNFICEDCMKPGQHKNCPFCGIPTVKYSGCDHMECPKGLGGCGIHWCYRCQGGPDEIFSSDLSQDVYDHLHDVHGNIWGAPEDMEDTEDTEDTE